jgi:uncharacterized protein involved in exopolysaccharide biosynthesis
MDSPDSQVRLLALALIRNRWAVPVALVLAAASTYFASRSLYGAPTYQSEAVALFRTAIVPEIQLPKLQVAGEPGTPIFSVPSVQQSMERETHSPTPSDLHTPDLELLLQSDAVLKKVAAAYNQSMESGKQMTPGAVRRHLAAITRVELKTVYEANYYPTVQLRATAASPDRAQALATAWARASADFLESMRRSNQRRTLEAIAKAHTRAEKRLQEAESSEEKGDAAGSETSFDVKLERAVVISLREAKLNAELALADHTPEFDIVSMPELPESPVRRQSKPILLAVFCGVAATVLIVSVCWTVLVDMARSVNATET